MKNLLLKTQPSIWKIMTKKNSDSDLNLQVSLLKKIKISFMNGLKDKFSEEKFEVLVPSNIKKTTTLNS